MIGEYINSQPRGAVASKQLPDGRVIDLLTCFTKPRVNISANAQTMTYDNEF